MEKRKIYFDISDTSNPENSQTVEAAMIDEKPEEENAADQLKAKKKPTSTRSTLQNMAIGAMCLSVVNYCRAVINDYDGYTFQRAVAAERANDELEKKLNYAQVNSCNREASIYAALQMNVLDGVFVGVLIGVNKVMNIGTSETQERYYRIPGIYELLSIRDDYYYYEKERGRWKCLNKAKNSPEIRREIR